MPPDRKDRILIARELESYVTGQEFARPDFVRSVILPMVVANDSELSELSFMISTYPMQAMVMSELCFMSDQFNTAISRGITHNPVMRELMIESSRQTMDWLHLKRALDKDAYKLLVNFWKGRLRNSQSLSFDKGLEPDLNFSSDQRAVAVFLEEKVPETSKGFRSMIIQMIKRDSAPEKNPQLEPSLSELANVITSYSFRNTEYLEGLHSNRYPVNEMTVAKLRYESRRKLTDWLIFINGIKNPTFFNVIVNVCHHQWCSIWEV